MRKHLTFALLALSLVGCSTLPPTKTAAPSKYQSRAVTMDLAPIFPPVAVSHPVLAWEIVGNATLTGLEQSDTMAGPWRVVASYPVTFWPATFTATTTVTNQAFWRAYTR